MTELRYTKNVGKTLDQTLFLFFFYFFFGNDCCERGSVWGGRRRNYIEVCVFNKTDVF